MRLAFAGVAVGIAMVSFVALIRIGVMQVDREEERNIFFGLGVLALLAIVFAILSVGAAR